MENSKMTVGVAAEMREGDVPQDLDAGALFVLKSKGSWVHCGYHLTGSIVAPALLSLPFAFASLGWGGGIFCLSAAAVVTFYSYNLLSKVLDHHDRQGKRLLRFRDMASHLLGPKWARYYVGPIQFAVCYGAIIASILLGGQSLKAICLILKPDGATKLYEFVIVFGALMLILAQVPSFHSLRYINLISLLLCLTYSACATVGSVVHAHNANANANDLYSLPAKPKDRIFGTFNAIAIIATTYGNGIIPEIQATIAPPVTGKMFKGLCLCYMVVLSTFASVAVSGYWAFGNKAQAVILSNFHATTLLPKWFIIFTYSCTILQLAAVAVVYLQPMNEVLERVLADPKKGQYSARNVVPRLVSRSTAVAVATMLAAMFPFFGDIGALIGAFGFLPLDFVIPPIFYNITFAPTRNSIVFWVNTILAVVFSIFSVVGSFSALRQIVIDAKGYHLFANI